MASEYARGLAAQVWCTPETEKIIMDPLLAEAFADILEKILNKPWLGNATNRELLEELGVRIDIHGPGLDYSTADSNNYLPV